MGDGLPKLAGDDHETNTGHAPQAFVGRPDDQIDSPSGKVQFFSADGEAISW